MKSKLIFLFTIFSIVTSPFTSNSQIITTIAGTTPGFSGDGGQATSAQLNRPIYIASDNTGVIYFTDQFNHRIRKIDTSGVISTVAGNGLNTYSGDGVSATVTSINHPYGIAIDGSGRMYIADQLNRRIRKIDVSGVISTFAGTGVSGNSGDGGPATLAEFANTLGITIDNVGNIYVADGASNNVRRIDTSGIISTAAGSGTGAYSGDGGPATAAELDMPTDVAVDGLGNLYIADGQNYRIRKVDKVGIITTFAGTGTSGDSGDGGQATAAQLKVPRIIAIDEIGNLYIADAGAHRLRKVSTSGIITTIAGTGVAGHTGDGGPATAAQIKDPYGINVDNYGNVYFAEWISCYIRKISSGNHLPAFTGGAAQVLNTCKNAGPASVDSLLYLLDVDTAQTITWTLLSGPYHGSAAASFSSPSIGIAISPAGLNYTPAAGYSGYDTFIVRADDGYSVCTTTIHVVVPDCTLGINGETTGNEHVLIYPNPNDGTFIVNLASGQEYLMTITNLLGETLQKTDITGQHTVRLNAPAGIYFLSLTGKDKKTVMKVIVR